MRVPTVCMWGFLGLAFLSGADSFNLDLMHPVVYHTQFPSDYFGYSLALHPGRENNPADLPWMMVGAPKANDSNYKSDRTNDVGLVYKCLFKGPCKNLRVDYEENLQRSKYWKELDGAMLGSVMDMSSDRFVVCSPKWKIKLKSDNRNYRMYGACYWGMSKDAENEVESFVPLAPVSGKRNKDIFQVGTVGYPNYMWGQAGFSAHLSNNSKGAHEMLLGAPSVRNWVGSTVTYRDGSDFAGGLAKRRRKRTPSNAFNQDNDDPFIPDPSLVRDVEKYGLLGYSVTSGRYFSRTVLISVAGAPSTFPAGKVFAYTVGRSGGYDRFLMKDVIVGDQLGEYFGAALASGDLNGDGLDDLVIGAPQFVNEKSGFASQNEGRVFVFFGSSTQKFAYPPLNREIRGDVYNGRFGTTIACVGDIDLDGFDDFAIAAPYIGSGIVFIYRGSAQGLVLSQRIIGSELVPKVAGFGFGISRGQDMDKNGYNDIAIGAYKSGHAIIIRSKPVIDLTPSVTLLGDKLKTDAKSLDAEICVAYHGPRAPEKIKVVMILTIDPGNNRLFRADSNSGLGTTRDVFDVSLNGFCGQIKFNLKNNINNFLNPIKIVAEFFMAPENVTRLQPLLVDGKNKISGVDGFCSSCALLRGNNYIKSAEIGFSFGCRDETRCETDIAVNMGFVDNKGQRVPNFVIGSASGLELKVTLTNSGDPSFNTKLHVILPSVPLSMSPSCRDATNGTTLVHLECDAGNPFKANTRRDFVFLVSMGESDVDARATVTSATPLANPNTASTALSLPLLSQADVTVYGKSMQENYRFELDVEKKEESKVAVTALYQIEKSGISPLQKVVLNVEVPVATSSGNKFLHFSKPKFYMNSRPLSCEPNEHELAKEADRTTGQTFSMAESLPGVSLDTSTSSASSSTEVRAKREVVTEQQLVEESKYPVNRTLFINCSNGEWKCTNMICNTELLFSHQVASLELKMHLDMSVLDSKLGQKDIAILRTRAQVQISKPSNVEQPLVQSPDETLVSIVLLRRIPTGKVETWVIALAIIGGILLLALLTAGLVKAGFFQRKVRDELLIKKRQTQMATGAQIMTQDGMDNDVFDDDVPTK